MKEIKPPNPPKCGRICVRVRKSKRRQFAMLEKEVEQYLCKKVKKELQGIAFKFVSPGFNGVPDRIVLVPMGRIYFVELKAPGKKLRKLQKWVCDLIRGLGFVVLEIDTKEKVDAFISEVQRNGI